ncbi:MAG: hypothetical protein HKN45_01275 [Flavobacteriales bacterium]|nr:hypothetical protein [Flavobacteriales bacterium]
MRTGRTKRYAMSALTIVLSMTMVAQRADKEERRAQLESKKVAYCTERAGLTPEESAQFWALRNEVDEQKKALMEEVPRRRDIDPQTASDDEIRSAIKKRLEQHLKAEQIEYDYMDRFMDIVSPRKFAMILKAEKEFKKEVLRKLGDRQRSPEGRGGRGSNGFIDER